MGQYRATRIIESQWLENLTINISRRTSVFLDSVRNTIKLCSIFGKLIIPTETNFPHISKLANNTFVKDLNYISTIEMHTFDYRLINDACVSPMFLEQNRNFYHPLYPSWASYQICEIVGCACAGNTGNVFPRRLQKKPLVSDPGMHHGTWCMPGSLTRSGGENVPGIPGACTTCNFTYLARGPWTSMPWWISPCITNGDNSILSTS